MLRNRYAKDIGGINTGQKIIHNKPQERVVLTPFLGIGGLIYPCTVIALVHDLEIEHSLLPDHAFGIVFLHTSVDLICPWTHSTGN